MPSHANVWCGSSLVSLQCSFCDRNHSAPASRASWIGGGVAEGVRQPDAVLLDAELLGEEPAAVHQLPSQRLAAGHVAVGLHPHSADRHERALADRLADAFEQLRSRLLDPRVLLRRGASEDQLRVLLGE